MNFNRFSLFKLPNTHRRFEYNPRFYDPKRERLEKKIADASRKGRDADGRHGRRIAFKERTAEKWGSGDYKYRMIMANVKVFIVLAIVAVVFYYVFSGLDFLGPAIDKMKN